MLIYLPVIFYDVCESKQEELNAVVLYKERLVRSTNIIFVSTILYSFLPTAVRWIHICSKTLIRWTAIF